MTDQISKRHQCPKCQNNVPVEAAFCPICGEAISAAEMPPGPAPVSPSNEIKCPRCEKKYLSPIPNYCERCGYLLVKAVSTVTPSRQAATPEQKPFTPEEPIETINGDQLPDQVSSVGWTPYQPGVGSTTTQPEPPAGRKKSRKPGRIPNGPKEKTSGVKKIALGSILLVMIVLGSWFVWKFLINDSNSNVAVEACSPVKPDENFEEANRLDLDGNLRGDSYFANGQEYTIASGATFQVPDGITLIIEPGARVKFGEGSKMIVEGTLLACGRSNRRILFTANTTTGKPGYWKGVEIRNADPDTVIGHASFEYAGNDYHAPLWIEGDAIHIEDLKFDFNAWYSLSLNPNSYPLVRPPLLVENGPEGWEIRAGEMTSTQKWDNTQPYIIRELLTIAENASLSISAGTTVKFLPNGAINIKGELSAIGESSNPVMFTSYNDGGEEGTPEPKSADWVGLRFYGREGTSRLENVEVAYAGQGGYREVGCLWMQDADPQLVNVSVSNCDGFAMSTDIASNPTIEKLDLEKGDILRRWELRNSNLEGSVDRSMERWTTVDGELLLPVVQGWVGITEEASLTLGSGFTMLFSEGDSGLRVDGVLKANGELKQPITLTTVRDPAYTREGGAQPGDWAGLHLKNNPSENLTLKYLIIQYGGRRSSPCLRLENSSPLLQNVSITNCASYAVSSDVASQPKVENLDIQDNLHTNTWEIRESSLNDPNTLEWAPLPGSNKSIITRLVTGVVTIGPEASLRLTPGLKLKFHEGKGIKASGTLLVEGTKEDPVVLTSWRDSDGEIAQGGPQAGDWGGVVLDGSLSTKISFLEIHYAGNPAAGTGCLNMANSQPSITDLIVTNCAFYPLTSDLASQPSVANLILEQNSPADEWAIRESQLARGEQRSWTPISQVQKKDPVLRTVIGRLTIDEGARLSIEKSVVVKFTGGTGLRVRGQINIEGNNREPVILTSWRDAEFSQGVSAQPGDWAGLVLEGSGADTTLQATQIRYAGGDQSPRGAIAMISASPILNQVNILDSAWYPLSVDALSNPVLDRLMLSNNLPSNAVEMRPDRLEASGETVWSAWKDADGKPLIRVVSGILTVGPQTSLRLSPNIVVKFAEDAGLDIYGNLITDQAVLTSVYDDQNGGNTAGNSSGEKKWLGVILHGRGLVQLSDTLIRYAGIGLSMYDAAPQLSRVSIQDSWEAALGSDLLSAPLISDLDIENNAINGLLILVDSMPEGVTHWDVLGQVNSQLVRVIRSPFTVSPNSNLVIAPGVIVKFTQQAGLIIEGGLELGTSEGEMVTLTALSDDSYGGNTDNLSNSVFRGAWTGLVLNPNNTIVEVKLSNVSILYAMTGVDLLNPVSFDVRGLRIAESQLFGMLCKSFVQFSWEDAEIDFQNNGQDFSGCTSEQ